MPLLHPAIFRARDQMGESMEVTELVAALDKIAARGSHGVLLKAPNDARVVAAGARLQARGIPVVTLVTDLPDSARLAYVGMDNRAAGRTAAYLLGQWLGAELRAGVLVSLSSTRFRGEEERERKREWAAKNRRKTSTPSTVAESSAPSTQAEAEAEAEADIPPSNPPASGGKEAWLTSFRFPPFTGGLRGVVRKS